MTDSQGTFKLNPKESFGVFLFYLIFSLGYYLVLWYLGATDEEVRTFSGFSLVSYWYTSGMQYLFFFCSAIIIWFLAIKLLRKRPLYLQVGVVVVLIPLFVYASREVRYGIIDDLGLFRLKGKPAIWDIYIPSLFMMVQFGFYFAYRYFQKSQRRIEYETQLRQAALRSDLTALKAQLNPHFLYNVFNSINASIPQENEHTRNLIAKLSDLFRYHLRASEQDLVSLGEEISFIEKYLSLEKERMGQRLDFEVEACSDLKAILIPPLLIQPLVENSIKHGISPRTDGGKIKVLVQKIEDSILFRVVDSGMGINLDEDIFSKGIGLKNTKLRLKKIYGSELRIMNKEPNGTIIEFSI